MDVSSKSTVEPDAMSTSVEVTVSPHANAHRNVSKLNTLRGIRRRSNQVCSADRDSLLLDKNTRNVSRTRSTAPSHSSTISRNRTHRLVSLVIGRVTDDNGREDASSR